MDVLRPNDDVLYFPSSVAMILGIQQREIWKWIEDGEMTTTDLNGRRYISHKSIVDYLHRHPENEGRIHHSDLIPFFNAARIDICNQLASLRQIFKLTLGVE